MEPSQANLVNVNIILRRPPNSCWTRTPQMQTSSRILTHKSRSSGTAKNSPWPIELGHFHKRRYISFVPKSWLTSTWLETCQSQLRSWSQLSTITYGTPKKKNLPRKPSPFTERKSKRSKRSRT